LSTAPGHPFGSPGRHLHRRVDRSCRREDIYVSNATLIDIAPKFTTTARHALPRCFRTGGRPVIQGGVENRHVDPASLREDLASVPIAAKLYMIGRRSVVMPRLSAVSTRRHIVMPWRSIVMPCLSVVSTRRHLVMPSLSVVTPRRSVVMPCLSIVMRWLSVMSTSPAIAMPWLLVVMTLRSFVMPCLPVVIARRSFVTPRRRLRDCQNCCVTCLRG